MSDSERFQPRSEAYSDAQRRIQDAIEESQAGGWATLKIRDNGDLVPLHVWRANRLFKLKLPKEEQDALLEESLVALENFGQDRQSFLQRQMTEAAERMIDEGGPVTAELEVIEEPQRPESDDDEPKGCDCSCFKCDMGGGVHCHNERTGCYR